MKETNINFQEEYKRLDLLCKDIFSSKEGISRYITEMENTEATFSRVIKNWDLTYKQLKHMRWMRNQLAHEPGTYQSNLCSEEDVAWLENFYNSILNRTDPLVEIEKIKESHKLNYANKNSTSINNNQTIDRIQSTRKISFWSRLKEKVKRWFS